MTWNAFHDFSISVSTGIHDFLTTHFLLIRPYDARISGGVGFSGYHRASNRRAIPRPQKSSYDRTEQAEIQCGFCFCATKSFFGKTYSFYICFYAVLLLMIMMALTRPCRILWATSWLEKKLDSKDSNRLGCHWNEVRVTTAREHYPPSPPGSSEWACAACRQDILSWVL